MLKLCSLYSGSTGNSLYVQSDNTKILVDAGVSGKKIVEALESINVLPEELDAILVSHEHTDHIKSVGTLSKKFNIPVYANNGTWNSMPSEQAKITSNNQYKFKTSEDFEIGDLRIHSFKTPHDAAESCGFSILNSNTKLSIATDLGHITKEIMNSLEDSSFIMLESNYEPEVLRACSYPYSLKTRISGPNGHLSNYDAGNVITTLMHSGLKDVMLGHLSKESNFPELAYRTVLNAINENSSNRNKINLNVASRFEPSKLLDVG